MAKPIRYLEESSEELGKAAAETWTFRLEPNDAPEQVVLAGVCPACGHDVDYRYPLALVRSESALAVASSPTLTVPVLCRCRVPHPGADGEAGCGRGWKLEVPSP